MKIVGQQPGPVPGLEKPRLGREAPGSAGKPGQPAGEERIELSDEARLLGELRAAVGDPLEVDQERVAELRARVASGDYRPSPQAVAEAMLRELLGNVRG